MSRPKGGKNKSWSKEEKLRIVRRYFDEHIGYEALAKEENISAGMIWNWVRKYRGEGENGLKNKKKTGNRFSALYNSQSLTIEERQRLIIEKQQIEIERLKKGYTVKGVGAGKEYVILQEKNTK